MYFEEKVEDIKNFILKNVMRKKNKLGGNKNFELRISKYVLRGGVLVIFVYVWICVLYEGEFIYVYMCVRECKVFKN